MHLWHNELRPRRPTTHRAEKVGSQDTHPKGAVCVPRSGSTFRVEDRERRATRASRAPRISCPQTLTPSGQSSSNRDFEQPSRLEMLGKENQTTRSNAGNYGRKTRFPVNVPNYRRYSERLFEGMRRIEVIAVAAGIVGVGKKGRN